MIIVLAACILFWNKYSCLHIKPNVFVCLWEAHDYFPVRWPLRYLTHKCPWVFISFKGLTVLPQKSYLPFIDELRNFSRHFYFVNIYHYLVLLAFAIFFFQFASTKNIQMFTICYHRHVVKTYILISISLLVFPRWNVI